MKKVLTYSMIVLIAVMLLRNSNAIKNLWGRIRSFKSVSDLGDRLKENQHERRIASLQARARNMGVRAEGYVRLAEELKVKQQELQKQIAAEIQQQGKEADAK